MTSLSRDIRDRVDGLDWGDLRTRLDEKGHAITPQVLKAGECSQLARLDGGEFVLLEQRPRAQSRAHVQRPPRGAFVNFPTQERPNKGTNGYHRVGMRHGVATVTRGERVAMGIIFHDAK